ncbi:MAG: hypothetical protein ACKV0T_26110 [Planctomycetales bacterium]
MNPKDLKTLRGQLWLTAALFLICVVLAAVIVSQRSRFEGFVKEKYSGSRSGLSSATRRAADDLRDGQAPSIELVELPELERRALYDLWMLDDLGPAERTAQILAETDGDFLLRCAEQTVVCGDGAQRERALEFLVACHSPKAREICRRLAAWARRRRRLDWQEQIEQALSRLDATEGKLGGRGSVESAVASFIP